MLNYFKYGSLLLFLLTCILNCSSTQQKALDLPEFSGYMYFRVIIEGRDSANIRLENEMDQYRDLVTVKGDNVFGFVAKADMNYRITRIIFNDTAFALQEPIDVGLVKPDQIGFAGTIHIFRRGSEFSVKIEKSDEDFQKSKELLVQKHPKYIGKYPIVNISNF